MRAPQSRPSVMSLVLTLLCGAVACDDANGETAPDVASDVASEADVAHPSVRVATRNIQCLIEDWDARLPVLVEDLAAVDPALFGIQEACEAGDGADNLTALLEALAERTGRDYRVERTVTHRAWNLYDEGIAVGADRALDETQVERLPSGVFPRAVVMVRVSTAVGTVVFATTHLDHQSAASRLAQIEAVIEALDEFAAPDEPRILTGDLNDAPTSDVATALAEADYIDAWSAAAEGNLGLTIPASAPTARIDYVWIYPGAAGLTALQAAVFGEDPSGGRYGSDHLGVTAEIGLAP